MTAEKKVLASTVHIDGEVYAAGTIPPAEIADRIDNPKAWTSGTVEATAPATADPDATKSEKKDKAKKDKKAKESTPESTPAADAGASTGTPDKPPAVGAGSGQKEWLAYARSLGLEFADDAKKGELVEAVAAHEKAQEA